MSSALLRLRPFRPILLSSLMAYPLAACTGDVPPPAAPNPAAPAPAPLTRAMPLSVYRQFVTASAPFLPGMVVVLFQPGSDNRVALASDPLSYYERVNALESGEQVKADSLIGNRVTLIPEGTKGVVIVPPMSAETVEGSRLVRLLDGPRPGHEGYVDIRTLLLVEVEEVVLKPPAEPPDRDTMAASLQQTGFNLEADGQEQAASGYYKRVSAEYSHTPYANQASERLKALGVD
jgi:hypothetical protein